MRMFLLTLTTHKQAADGKENKPMNQDISRDIHLIREWEHSRRLTFNIPFIYHHTPTIALCFSPPLLYVRPSRFSTQFFIILKVLAFLEKTFCNLLIIAVDKEISCRKQ